MYSKPLEKQGKDAKIFELSFAEWPRVTAEGLPAVVGGGCGAEGGYVERNSFCVSAYGEELYVV